MPYNRSIIVQAISVKVAGYWTGYIYIAACIFKGLDDSSRTIKTQKDNLANIQPA